MPKNPRTQLIYPKYPDLHNGHFDAKSQMAYYAGGEIKIGLVLSQSRSSFLIQSTISDRLRIHFHFPTNPNPNERRTICPPRHVAFPSHCCLYAASFVRALSPSLLRCPRRRRTRGPRLFMCLPFYGNDTAAVADAVAAVGRVQPTGKGADLGKLLLFWS